MVGARPNLMKIAPVIAALNAVPGAFEVMLLHTGQHYDEAMNEQFFRSLAIPAPHFNLGVGSASHAVQTAEVMQRFEPILERTDPAAVLVVGDVNSTLACALVAAKKCVPVVHVEAGLRSFDRAMPEEINRVLTDQISDLLFTTERNARDNLLREGIAASRIHFAGNVMIDTLYGNLPRAIPMAETLAALSVDSIPGSYGVLTLHRPSNVDSAATLKALLGTIAQLAGELPIIFPLHPRTHARIEEYGLAAQLHAPGMIVTPPLDYLQMLGLLRQARVVLTDSGGIQEETTALGVPCLTLRDSTERPITVSEGTNTLVGRDPALIRTAFHLTLHGAAKAARIPEFWDGKAAQRIATVLCTWLQSEATRRVA